MVGNSAYSKVAINQIMGRHKPHNQYGDICHPEYWELSTNIKFNFLFK
jgi:hypothetical protein